MERKKPLLKTAFPGNKINRVREIENLIKDKKYKRVVEVFGGSCCISNNLKYSGLVETAIANDYDNYFKNFDYNIQYKEKLITYLLGLGFTKSQKALPAEQSEIIQEYIKKEFYKDDLIRYLAKNFVFSSRRASGEIKLSDFNYLDNELSTGPDKEFFNQLKNIQLESLDYSTFIDKYLIKGDDETLVILDPPYLNSAQKQYYATFFGLTQTIRLLKVMKEYKNDFIFFNMIESDTIELLNLFNFTYSYSTRKQSMAAARVREDFMAYVKFDKDKTPFNPSLN